MEKELIRFKGVPKKIGTGSRGVLIPAFCFNQGYLQEGVKYEFVIFKSKKEVSSGDNQE